MSATDAAAPRPSPVTVRRAEEGDGAALVPLLAGFRVALAALHGRTPSPDLEAARRELADYRARRYPIFVAEIEGQAVGLLVCRVDDDVVWAEALYVAPPYRRRGVAAALYAQAEALAARLGSPTVYNWVHPNNTAIIRFLKKRGYDVLNMVEVRRPLPGESLAGRVQVGPHEFAYPVDVKQHRKG